MKKQLTLIALASLLALALVAGSRAAEPKAKAAKPAASQEPSYTATCRAPCEFSMKSHDKAEVTAAFKAHSKTHHHADLSDQDAGAAIKMKAAKKAKE